MILQTFEKFQAANTEQKTSATVVQGDRAVAVKDFANANFVKCRAKVAI